MVSFQCVPACVVCAHLQCVCVYSRRCFRPLCTLEPWLNDKIMWMKNITKYMVSFQCVPVCVVCAHFQCACVYSRRCLCPLCTLQPCFCHSLSILQLFTFSLTLYMPVFVSNLFVCVTCIFIKLCLSAHSVPFCHCVSVSPLFSLPTVSVSDQISLCPLCLYCSCPLSVFVSSLVGVCAHSASARSVYSWCSCPFYFTPRLMNLLFQACAGMWMHILVHAFCKIINWIIYQLCRCIL